MKKAISLLLALVMVFAFAACGNSKDKEKLIGEYHYSFERSDKVSDGFYLAYDEDWYISFFPDNTFYYEVTGLSGKIIDNQAYDVTDEAFIGSGTYKMKKGFITLEYDEDSELSLKLPSSFKEPIPYSINEYTKKLVFDVKNDGTTDWSRITDNPTKPE